MSALVKSVVMVEKHLSVLGAELVAVFQLPFTFVVGQ